jgi:acetyl esterase/lipase
MHTIGLVRRPPESSEGYNARVNQIRNNWLSAHAARWNLKEKTRREFLRSTLTSGIALGLAPAIVSAQSAQQPTPQALLSGAENDLYDFVDPELLPAVKSIPKLHLTNETLAWVRQQEQAQPLLPPPAPQPVERRIPGPVGAPDLRLTIVDPAPGGKARPVLVHTHGGGYVARSAALAMNFLQTAAQTCNCVVVSVDYRLAPETRFPGSLEDNYTALRWVYANADALGVDRNRFAVGGESAGGGHAAMLAIAARDRKEIPLAFQLLIYPMLDDRTGSSQPVPPHIGAFVWTAESNRFGWTSLLGIPAGSPKVPPGSVPARVENLAGLPPAFIVTGAIDLFVDEDIEYARRLIAAGVPTELHVVPGAYHGYDLLVPNAKVSARFADYWTTALRRALAPA